MKADREAKVGLAQGRWRALSVLCVSVVLAMTTWFSATAVTPELGAAFDLSPAALSWLTNGVQLGFVAGAILSSLVNLPDIVRLNRLMAGAALVATLANASLLVADGPAGLIAARFVTGAALAAVYPPAMKLVSTWFVSGRGFALGAIIAAITFGSALPHLVRAMTGAVDWHLVVVATSLATLAASAIFLLFAREGPFPFGKAVFDPRQIGAVFRDRPLRLAIFGYLGHMWELYGAWAWLLLYTRHALETQGTPSASGASLITFASIAAGAVGCLLGGVLSDRIGRTLTTAGMMIVSGICAAGIGLVFGGPLWLFVAVALVWGVSIVGDSAQFSTAVTELADQRYVGTALSVQVGLGFALTVFTIWLLPHIAEAVGWRWVFLVLAIGPAFGAASMLRLRRIPESVRLAGGLR
ncbi:MFS transporter [Acuticoccus kandeliae]|uniref:MFS transporter n=1 Tax=Acuticoccus kandeliae TaxID=2073160 RepID=UPI000D3E0C30|nr:MFS transporter [Acuticoccus kandeliae]